ncbi:hypothetical protein [Brevibacterium luteolum]|uniref:Uncharacterized protein n=1 Tax=Brevibacterium luteolum TaxID=199591 RepID=A0A6G8KXJ4_9MICO|nr:hypothetical protein [Brevibacterium luteolum]MBU8579424.1 hypothetical protein [Brevibacterium luteolum]QIN29534.1 hypothetical protein EW640_09795 [Brevibacterium luteolum]
MDVADVTQQSKERLNDRIAAVEALAVAHNARVAGEDDAKRRREELEAELSELIGALERDHKASYDAAVKAGWTARDLRAMGLSVPSKPAPKRRRRKPAATTGETQQADHGSAAEDSAQHESAAHEPVVSHAV